jgi:putative membrane protein
MWYWNGGGIHWWGEFIGSVITVGFWALIIIIFLFLTPIRSFAAKDHDHAPPRREDPERSLARRFANGEIDEEEFHRHLEVLWSDGFANKL